VIEPDQEHNSVWVCHHSILIDIASDKASFLRLQPTFSVQEFIRLSILFERESDRSALREGLLKAGLPA
jgi:hypothetical protein